MYHYILATRDFSDCANVSVTVNTLNFKISALHKYSASKYVSRRITRGAKTVQVIISSNKVFKCTLFLSNNGFADAALYWYCDEKSQSISQIPRDISSPFLKWQ